MAEKTDAPAAVTEDKMTAALSSFGEKLLAQVDAKLAANKPEEKPEGEALNVNDVRAAESKRCSELFALAQNAGLSEWQKTATGWIEKGLSVVEAKAVIGEMAIAQNGLTKDTGDPGSDDPEAKYKKEYQQNAAAFTAMGLSLAEYITSRKIDDGAELLAPAKKEAA